MKQSIFIHIPRTAGTSMGKVFKKLHSHKIITYQDIASNKHPKFNPETDITNTLHVSIQSLINRKIITDLWFDECFKFTFVRNPWDRLVSLFEHLQYRIRRQSRDRESNQFLHSFEDFARVVCTGRYVKPVGRWATNDWSQANPQVEWLKWGVDFVGKYEYLHADWNYVCKTIGISCELGYHNQSSKSKHYRCYYDRELAEMVGDFYQEDVDRFGYKF